MLAKYSLRNKISNIIAPDNKISWLSCFQSSMADSNYLIKNSTYGYIVIININ